MIRTCDICGSDRGDVVHTFSFTLHDGVQLPASYDLVSCRGCGFVFADTPATQQMYDRFYGEQSKYEDKGVSSGGNSSPWDRERFEAVVKYLEGFVPKDAAILDIGCANGGLLLALRDAGFKRLMGLDPSPRCVDTVCATGIEARQGGIFADGCFSTDSRGFDCILLSHVLEHVRDLSPALAWVQTRLAGGGQVYVEVPDASRYAEYYKIPYYYFDCEHINHFEPASLSNLFLSAGFTPCDMRQHDIPTSAEDRYPVIAALFRRKSPDTPEMLDIAHDAAASIEAYLSRSAEDDVFEKIDMLADGGEAVMVWGAGQYALRLLSASRLKECRIVSFIDKDCRKQGTTLCSIPISSPEVLRGHRGPIVVCSALHSAEISAEIREMGLDNTIVVLKGTRI